VHTSQARRQEGGAALFPDRPVLPRGIVLRGPPNLGGAQGPAPRCETARRAILRSGTVHLRRCGSGLGGWAPGARDSNPTDPLGRPEVPVPRVVTWSVGSVGLVGSARAGGLGVSRPGVSRGAVGQRGLGPVWAQGRGRGCGVSGARARSGPRGCGVSGAWARSGPRGCGRGCGVSRAGPRGRLADLGLEAGVAGSRLVVGRRRWPQPAGG